MGVGAGLYMYVVVVQKFTFAISSPDEFLFQHAVGVVVIVEATVTLPLLGSVFSACFSFFCLFVI